MVQPAFALPTGTLHVPYVGTIAMPNSFTLTVPTNAVLPVTYALADGALPAGMSLYANTLWGTPTAAGTSAYTISVNDSRIAGPYPGTPAPTTVVYSTTLTVAVTAVLPASGPVACGGTIARCWRGCQPSPLAPIRAPPSPR